MSELPKLPGSSTSQRPYDRLVRGEITSKDYVAGLKKDAQARPVFRSASTGRRKTRGASGAA